MENKYTYKYLDFKDDGTFVVNEKTLKIGFNICGHCFPMCFARPHGIADSPPPALLTRRVRGRAGDRTRTRAGAGR